MSRTIFAIQVALSAVGMGIGAGMLWAGRDPAVYLPIVTSIIGYWLPAPTPPPPPAHSSSKSSASSVNCTNDEANQERTSGEEVASDDEPVQQEVHHDDVAK